jgi:hypothetical protein
MVAALNAARWWNLPDVLSQDSPAWKKWISRCGARYGAATRVDLLHRHLGLAAVSIVPEAYTIEDCLRQGVPIEATIWEPSEGLHAILLVPGLDARRRLCVVVLGMIRKKRKSERQGAGSDRQKRALVVGHEYVQVRMSVERLLADYCFPIGNPNRSFRALVPWGDITGEGTLTALRWLHDYSGGLHENSERIDGKKRKSCKAVVG